VPRLPKFVLKRSPKSVVGSRLKQPDAYIDANKAPVRFALIGNPNCGKTSLFNRLTGARAKVANYPGVTVERRSGMISGLTNKAELLDLPGTYSLFVTSPDEQVARDFILGNIQGEARPDVLIAVVDATNLRLVMELRSLNRPLILALNQMDAARSRGISIDTASLSKAIGISVIETVAVNSNGTDALKHQLDQYAHQQNGDAQILTLSDRQESVEALYDKIESLIRAHVIQPAQMPRWQDRLDNAAPSGP